MDEKENSNQRTVEVIDSRPWYQTDVVNHVVPIRHHSKANSCVAIVTAQVISNRDLGHPEYKARGQEYYEALVDSLMSEPVRRLGNKLPFFRDGQVNSEAASASVHSRKLSVASGHTINEMAFILERFRIRARTVIHIEDPREYLNGHQFQRRLIHGEKLIEDALDRGKLIAQFLLPNGRHLDSTGHCRLIIGRYGNQYLVSDPEPDATSQLAWINKSAVIEPEELEPEAPGHGLWVSSLIA